MRGLSIFVVPAIPEVRSGDDLGSMIASAIATDPSCRLIDGDILAVTSKVVSKAEGCFEPDTQRDRVIEDETRRVVAERRFGETTTRIVENRLGIVGAAAGVDASNTPPGTILRLPRDPDASAAAIRSAVETRFSIRVGVVVTDTLGRPWRTGQTDIAIGGSGLRLLDDLTGTVDAGGRPLAVTTPAVGDEIAAAADLVKGKSSGFPVAVVRGLGRLLSADARGAEVLLRPAHQDWFRLGSDEAWSAGFDAGRATRGHPRSSGGRPV